jgi:hypothetical protein
MRATAAIGLVLLLASCSRAPSLSDRVREAGGAVALVRDCEAIFAASQKTQKENWTADDPELPPAIASLHPQIVTASHAGEYPLVDIQIVGGFTHHGLMVILADPPPDFRPRKSSWKVTRITDRIFEYEE